ncbi:fumarylacetoacetate hydrolase family protein [Leptothrix discophora]|uniref:Fumarylacetoacetate hydrolase family protein n=1 Tax=Leptothrix discophora TaxID=89 RepID=A0ABT9G8G8_LEPDI|nr:fumarylacetoacetate hydrolase family protein [Leptothrix discophora]MDP4302700.1 fumarylacetoacetate hydrolase family protein [Leptothrix discophora]
MKLASYKDGSRDGQLVVVSRDLTQALHATGIASRLQAVLDDWNFLAPQLQDLAHTLNHGKARHAFPFDPAMCMAPLPRAPRWVQAGAYPAARERQCVGLGQAVPDSLRSAPLLRERPSDLGLGARQDLSVRSLDGGIDHEVHWAVLTGDIAAGATPDQALEGVRLVGLVNAWSLRETADGAAASLPAGWAPALVTLDELEGAWMRGRLGLRIGLRVNGQREAQLASGEGQHWHVGQLLSMLARERPIVTGTVLSCGPIGAADASAGVASRAECIAEAGSPRWLEEGDLVEVEALDAQGHPVFGPLRQSVVVRG